MENFNLENLFLEYAKILVIANSKSLDKDFFRKINNGNDTLVVVFNRVGLTSVPESMDILWVHRFQEETGFFFGADFKNHLAKNRKIYHLCVKNSVEIEDKKPDWSIALVSAREIAVNMSDYPIGKRLISFKKKYITSPSTGFVILLLLNCYKKSCKIKAEIKAIGFGQLTDGCQEHYWQYERRSFLSFEEIVFLNYFFKKESLLMMVRSLVPDFLVRLFFDVKKKILYM